MVNCADRVYNLLSDGLRTMGTKCNSELHLCGEAACNMELHSMESSQVKRIFSN
jgi:hypothetical protein